MADEPKPRFRVTTDGWTRPYVPGQPPPPPTARILPGRPTADSYQNFMASVGYGTRNLSSGSTYGFNPITRERTMLEWMYRGSWICGVAVDSVADDAVKMGIDFGGQVPPDDAEQIDQAMRNTMFWQQVNELIKWGRLYGGAIASPIIHGQDPETPLRPETVAKGSYRGLLVLDRWMVEPSLNDLVKQDESATDHGLPRYYLVSADAPAYPRNRLHYTRCFRYEGFSLPYQQRLAENLWGMSVFERLFDRLVAFDSATQGIAQLVYKAYLRWVKIKNLRAMISAGGADMRRILNQLEMMRTFQTNEGFSILDADDDFGTTTYSFDGLDTVLLQFGQQLSGALQIPLVRLFGQSPAGLNSTGESDLRTYYDGVHQQQELRLRRPVDIGVTIIARSEGIPLPAGATYKFRPLWQLTTKEKGEIAEQNTRTILAPQELGLISERRALEEMRQSAQETGIWSTITDEEVEAASDELPPPAGELAQPGGTMAGAQPGFGAQPGPEGAGEGAGEGEGEGEKGERPPGAPGAPGTPGKPPGGRRGLPVALPTVHLKGAA